MTSICSKTASTAAVAGGAFLALAPQANATVIYSGIQNISVGTDLNDSNPAVVSTNISVDGLLDTFAIEIDDAGIAFNMNLTPLNGAEVTASGTSLSALTAGTVIDGTGMASGEQFLVSKLSSLNYGDQLPHYFGIRFDHSGNTVYGWAQAQITFGATDTLTIIDWAYEDSGAAILAGATTSDVPEPSSWALFAIGAAGLAALRRRRGKSKNQA